MLVAKILDFPIISFALSTLKVIVRANVVDFYFAVVCGENCCPARYSASLSLIVERAHLR